MWISKSVVRLGDQIAPNWQLDPFEARAGGHLTLSRVSIVRLVCVAAESGARLQRDGLPADPLQWMITPAPIFHGRPPIEACVTRDACSKAILLHGLGLDLDTDADTLDRLVQWDQPVGEDADCD